jgi:hypothetical protein
MSVHCEEKPYKCDFCSHSSKQRGNMKIHLMRKHPDLFPQKKRKKEAKDRLPKKLPHKSRPMCKTAFNCSVCGDGFVREDSYKSHMKQHKELAIVMENTALAVLQLQTPVTNIVRAVDAASGGQTQEATVSSSCEAEVRGEENMVVDEGEVSHRPRYAPGDARTVVVERGSGQELVVEVSGVQPIMVPVSVAQGLVLPGDGPQSHMVAGSAPQSVMVTASHALMAPARENPAYEVTDGAVEMKHSSVEEVQPVSVDGSMTHPASRAEQVCQIASVYSTSAVASTSNFSKQMSTARKNGQSSDQVQPQQISSCVQTDHPRSHIHNDSSGSAVSNFMHQGKKVMRFSKGTRTPTANPAITITHTPLNKSKKQMVHTVVSPSCQSSAATISHQPVLQMPAANPPVVYRLSQVTEVQTGASVTVGGLGEVASRHSDGNGHHVAPQVIPEQSVVVQVPICENAPGDDASGHPAIIQAPVDNDCQVAPLAHQNLVPPGAVQRSDSNSGLNEQVVMHIRTNIENPSIPMQVSPVVAPPGQSQVMVQVPAGSETGICYRLVPQVAAADGSVTYSLLPQPYLPRQNQGE